VGPPQSTDPPATALKSIQHRVIKLPHPLPSKEQEPVFPPRKTGSWGLWVQRLDLGPAPTDPSELWGEMRSLLAAGMWGSALVCALKHPNPEARQALWGSVTPLAWACLRSADPFLTPSETITWLDLLGPAWLSLPASGHFLEVELEEGPVSGALAYQTSRHRTVTLHFEGLKGPKSLSTEKVAHAKGLTYSHAGMSPGEEGKMVVWKLTSDPKDGCLLWVKVRLPKKSGSDLEDES
jgi:hypothetical protein